MPVTYSTDGAFAALQPGNDTGAASSGIGIGANNSGLPPSGNFTSEPTTDFVLQHIGGGATATSAGNTGQIIQNPAAITAGSGYTNGTYDVTTADGGVGAVQGLVRITVAGGAITAAVIVNAGGNFTTAPTVSLAGLGAGTGGAVTLTIGLGSRAVALGAAFGANKGMRRVTATTAAANGAAVTPSTYINRSGRTLVIGDSLWAVAP